MLSFRIERVVDKLMVLEPMLRQSMDSDSDLYRYLEKNPKAKSVVACFASDLGTVLSHNLGAYEGAKEQTTSDREIYAIAFNHMRATQGWSMMNYLKLNKNLLQFLEVNLDKLDPVFAKFSAYQQHKMRPGSSEDSFDLSETASPLYFNNTYLNYAANVVVAHAQTVLPVGVTNAAQSMYNFARSKMGYR